MVSVLYGVYYDNLNNYLCYSGSYFCFDNPGALQDNFIQDMDLSTSQFVYLYSWYSWPNVIMCFIGGFLIDRCYNLYFFYLYILYFVSYCFLIFFFLNIYSVFGIRLGTIIYALLVVVGQILFASGAYLNNLWVMVLGRLVFG